ncbi:MAG TPA: hypothetical protein VNL91_05355 [Thermoanaerobaculia bacterium]|nr:hypothetical protein [Thermoanaerobaculia bacterium]
MGVAVWIASGAAATLLARIVPPRHPWSGIDPALSGLSAIGFGTLATLLDFGGWREPDWRAALFVFLATFGLAGVRRTVQIRKKP